MDLDHAPPFGSVGSDDLILEERNGSPPPTAKRRLDDSSSPNAEMKKPRLTSAPTAAATTTPVAKPKKDDTAAKKNGLGAPSAPTISSKDKDKDVPVELKAGKFVLKQKSLNWDSTSSTMRARLAFTEHMATLREDDSAKLSDWPKEQYQVVAHLVHESDKTASGIVQSIRKQLVDYIQGSIAAGEDSQDADKAKNEGVPLLDRIPANALKALIESIASRVNYGLDIADLPDGLPTGQTEMPAGLQIWRWEVNDPTLLPPELVNKLGARKVARSEVKAAAVALFLALPPDEQADLLSKSTKKRPVKDAITTPTLTAPIASGSGAAPAPTKKNVKLEEDTETAKEREEKAKIKAEKDAEKAEKAKIKAEKDAEREAKKVAKDRANTEREEKKAKRVAAEERKRTESSKQSAFLQGFFVKKSTSPAPVSAAARASITPGSNTESDFDRVFKPFFVKSDVVVAPINRFRKAKAGKAPEVKVNSRETLTLEESLRDFLSTVPKYRILPHNPHPTPSVSVRDAVHSINDSAVTGMDASQIYNLLENRSKVQLKLLKFSEDVRPGYSGTWSKTSRVVGPRTPFGRDTALLRYDYDSEDEWEEEEVGQDVEDVGSTGERSDDDGSEDGSLSDDWMCEDDEVEFEPGHGEDEGLPMDTGPDSDLIIVESATEIARRKVLDRERKSKSAKEGAKRKRLAGPLLPLVKGPVWEQKIGHSDFAPFDSMKIQFLNDASMGINPFEWTSKPFSPPTAALKTSPRDAASGSTTASTSSIVGAPTVMGGKASAKGVGKPPKPFPSTLMPKFISLVQGADVNKAVLVNTLYSTFKEHKVTQHTVVQHLETVAFRHTAVNGRLWEVKAPILAQYPAAAARAKASHALMIID